jgi:ubiquinone/menaquinone biosynthesis C-methylase UbiE
MTTWPKRLPELTDEQMAIRDDYMNYFYSEVYSARFGRIQRFNHTYAARSFEPGLSTLDLGAGLGEHLEFEDGRAGRYVALELRPEMAREIERRHPYVTTVVGDVESGLDFESAEFDRVLAIHVLEHLPNLPAALEELRRILRPGGVLSVVLPCEGGMAYTLGRRLTTQRAFERRYGMSFDWCIQSEHVSVLPEIVHELDARFECEHTSWFPSLLPTMHTNICAGLTYRRR